MSRPKTISTDKARAAWACLPDWIAVLAAECDRTSQGAAGKRLRRPGGLSYSGSVVNQVLANSYGGSLSEVETAVRSALMAATVFCPVVGEMSIAICLDHQRADWSARTAMIREACGTCSNNRNGGES